MDLSRFSDEELRRIAAGGVQDTSGSRPAYGGMARAFASNAADSLSLGFGDEIMGAGAGALSALRGGDFQEGFDQQVRASRDRLEEARFWHPGVSIAGSIAGGVALGGGLGLGLRGLRAAAALRNLSPVQRIGAAAFAGAGFGGAYGAGSADYQDAAGRTRSGFIGAGMGAALGGGLQGVGMGGHHLWRNLVRTADPAERAALELGKSLNRSGVDEQGFAQRVRDLQGMETLAPGSNPMVMDALGPSGTDAVMAAATRASAERNIMRDALDARNRGAAERVTSMLWRELGGGRTRSAARTVEELEATQRTQAAPLYAQVYARRVAEVPRPLRDFIAFHDRPGAAFGTALQTTRETLRRQLGVNATDEQMMRQPMFWHRLLENVEAEVGATFRAARVNPLGAPRGSAIADMTGDARLLNTQIRRLLGPEFRQAQDIYAGAARAMEAVELGYSAVSQQGNLQLGAFMRRLGRMSQSEREHAQFAAISRIADDMARADTGTGRANVLRAVIGNQSKRNVLRELFGGNDNFARVMRVLDYEADLFSNSVNTGIRVNSITADKYLGNQQMFSGAIDSGGLLGMARQALGREARESYDEQVANEVLRLMRTPLAGADAATVAALPRERGLLSRAMKEAERQRRFRARVGPQAATNAAINAVGFSPDSRF